MRPFILFLLLYSICTAKAQNDSVGYLVPGKIIPLKQKNDMACWITVATMMLCWRDTADYSVDSLAVKLGDPWKLYYELNTGLPAKMQGAFVKAIGLKAEPPANYLLLAYIKLLKDYGPLWIITGDEFGAHARMLYGIEGDGSYDNSSFLFIDPFKGKTVKENSLVFFKEFEEEARVANRQEAEKKGSWPDLRIQIYHF
jgi:Papain-like cysteine protease AvrRpt2